MLADPTAVCSPDCTANDRPLQDKFVHGKKKRTNANQRGMQLIGRRHSLHNARRIIVGKWRAANCGSSAGVATIAVGMLEGALGRAAGTLLSGMEITALQFGQTARFPAISSGAATV
jgi:hypothetical protein